MSVTDEVVSLSKMVAEVFSNYNDPANADSLTKYSKTASVVSRVYVEDKLIDEDIMVPLMGTLNQIYISYVLTALQLNTAIGSYDVIRNALARVSTENFEDIFAEIDSHFSADSEVSLSVSTEAANIIEIEKKVAHLASGKVIEFDFIVSEKDGKPVTVTVPIHVSLMPNTVTSAVADAFLTLNFAQSTGRRWKKVKAGEISLFRDFLLSRDLVAKYAKAMREDDTNALKTMMDANNKARGKKFKKVANGGVGSNNIASSILVFEKRTFDRAANEGGFDFTNPKDRQTFFNASLSMLIVVVDTMYDSIDIYYNGMDQFSTFTYRMIEKSGSAKDSIDMKTVMATLAKGSAPKF
jgi:hypothetical protein